MVTRTVTGAVTRIATRIVTGTVTRSVARPVSGIWVVRRRIGVRRFRRLQCGCSGGFGGFDPGGSGGEGAAEKSVLDPPPDQVRPGRRDCSDRLDRSAAPAFQDLVFRQHVPRGLARSESESSPVFARGRDEGAGILRTISSGAFASGFRMIPIVTARSAGWFADGTCASAGAIAGNARTAKISFL